jgi:hypothetical protein
VKNVIGILMGIVLNMQSSFGCMAIFTMLILSIHKHRDPSIFWCLLWLLSSVAYSFHWKDLWFHFVKFIPKYFIFRDYCKWYCSPDFFLNLFIFAIKETYWFLWINFVSWYFFKRGYDL